MRPVIRPTVGLMIVGTPRSGTTLLQRMAVESCGFRGAPETHFFSLFPRLLSEGAPRSRRHSREHLSKALRDYSLSPQLEGADLQPNAVLAHLEGRQVGVYDMFEAVVAVISGGPDRLCEKTPGHLWWWDKIAAARASTRFAMIVRDPRAVIASMVEARFADLSLSGYVEWWRHDQHLVELARQSLGSRCLVLRYEDVVASEARTRRALQTLCAGLRIDPGRLADGSLTPSGKSLALPAEIWKAGYDGPVTTDRVESWRTRLTADEADFIVRATSAEMRRWGYTPGAPGPAPVRDALKQGERLYRRVRLEAYRRRQRPLLSQIIDLR